VAISADHTTIVCGHSQGHLIVWDIRKPQHPIRTIEPIPPNQTLSTTTLTTTATTTANQAGSSRKEGHVRGAAILHVGFIGIKKSEIVSGDDQGMAFYHVLYKVVMVNAVDTTRILGRYQNLSLPSSPSSSSSTAAPAATTLQPSLPRMGSSSSLLDSGTTPFNKPRRPSTVFAMQALPLGQFAHPAENFGLVALLTPYKVSDRSVHLRIYLCPSLPFFSLSLDDYCWTQAFLSNQIQIPQAQTDASYAYGTTTPW
jgi:hypothetical protein